MTTIWNLRNIITSSWDKRNDVTSSWDRERVDSYLLQETFDYLLLEDGWKIELDQYWVPDTIWTPRPQI